MIIFSLIITITTGRKLYNISKYQGKKYACYRCLSMYLKEDILKRHIDNCKGVIKKTKRIEMPEEGIIF